MIDRAQITRSHVQDVDCNSDAGSHLARWLRAVISQLKLEIVHAGYMTVEPVMQKLKPIIQFDRITHSGPTS